MSPSVNHVKLSLYKQHNSFIKGMLKTLYILLSTISTHLDPLLTWVLEYGWFDTTPLFDFFIYRMLCNFLSKYKFTVDLFVQHQR